jgi:hypothetical protein
MKSDRGIVPQPSQPVPSAAPAVRLRVYEPPAVCWEQPFVALAQVSRDPGCPIPGSCEDMP